ncbi:MAG: tetratricopeptide repeat protein [Saprospiraceae bacterium]|nr:tetratricopeptide repeat protein [Saprospiraceae bacterium]
MKKSFFALIFLMVGVVASQAQADIKEAKKNLKTAEKAVSLYNLDNRANSDKLEEGIEAIKQVVQNDELAATAAPFLAEGDLYLAVASRDVSMPMLDPNWKPVDYDAAEMAFMAYSKALPLSQKKFETEAALKGLSDVAGYINNEAVDAYNNKDFENAYKGFATMLKIHDLLVENQKESFLSDDAKVNDQYLFTGICALQAGAYDVAEEYLKKLYDRGYHEAGIYESFFNLYQAKGDSDMAKKYLEEGLQKYPDDTGLLFAQINLYLQEERTDELVGKLEMAIEKEPTNKSLYSTLGQVHDKLYQAFDKEGRHDEADKHFEAALKNYEKALEIDPNYSDAVYSIGTLYYNKAALMSQELNELANDYSKEGIKKYDALKAKIDVIFDQALPFFQKAEAMDPMERNALIALKEIYARKNQLDMSNEFKERLDKIDAGETITSSYFKNN